jgi:hypothetical protein
MKQTAAFLRLYLSRHNLQVLVADCLTTSPARGQRAGKRVCRPGCHFESDCDAAAATALPRGHVAMPFVQSYDAGTFPMQALIAHCFASIPGKFS